tara:strand:+ start:232 stop:813 length:582 start_codon:yes stop_codon:yes gene_type:complete
MYDVGDILYVISNKRRNVVPVQVVEQIVRRTAKAEEVTFKVQLPTPVKGKEPEGTVDLHSIQGSVHRSLEEVRVVLYDQASSAINDLLQAAQQVASTKFTPPVKKKAPPPEPDPSELIIQEAPQSYYQDPPQSVPEAQKPLEIDVLAVPESTAFSAMEEASLPSVLDFTGASDETEVKVQMPDGTYAKVKTNI